MRNKYMYLWVYLAITFGVWWGVAITFTVFHNRLVKLIGGLTLLHPLIIVMLYLPSIAGLAVYFLCGGKGALKGIFLKLVPRRRDLIWFPVLTVVFIIFYLSMHYGSIAFGFKVPKITYSLPTILTIGSLNFFKEAGLIGGIFGWVGFLLPFLQDKLKNNIKAALLTGFIFGLWVLPGYLISSFGTSSSYFLYVLQLMVFILFQSYIFNATRGCLLFYLFSFWLAATGSHVQLYYFNSHVQLLQVIFFTFAAIVTHVLLKKIKVDSQLQRFPSFIMLNPEGYKAGLSKGTVDARRVLKREGS